MKNKKYSIEDFKEWMDKQGGLRPLEGQEEEEKICVRSRLSEKRLIDKIDVEDGDLFEIAKDFSENDGWLQDEEDKTMLIEVKSGTFFIPSRYVRKVR